MVVIIDLKMGNMGSVRNMFRRLGVEAQISNHPSIIRNATKLILPGVGAFDQAIHNIQDLGIREVLNEKVLGNKTPTLGICLGMQILTEKSEEGLLPGLGWIPGEAKRFHFPDQEKFRVKIPHMGWNTIEIKTPHGLFKDLELDSRFYFVHSYYVQCRHEQNVLGTTYHGISFHSAIFKENVLGTQFHPEKSHKFGMKVFENFLRI